jgi:hypothetical protein
VVAAERQARRLLRRCTIEQHALITSNPRAVIESCPQELFTAVGYPETITTTARMIQSRAAT